MKIRNLYIGDDHPIILMAAVNLSLESFYKNSIVKWDDKENLTQKLTAIIEDGAQMVDFGPQSSAPVNIYGEETHISPKEEIKRLSLSLDVIRDIDTSIIVSVDTQSSEVAEFAFSKDVDIINDISGLKNDSDLARVINDHSGFAIIMPCEKIPGDVYQFPNVLSNLLDSKSLLEPDKVIIDPGIGGWVPNRNPDDDFRLIMQTPELKLKLQCPALIALSRKSFIGKTLNLKPEDRLYGSLSATAVSVLFGANIIRTHDIIATNHAVKIAEKFKEINYKLNLSI